MDKIAYDKMTRQFLFAPLALMVSLALGIVFYLSYTKYDNSKNSLIGLTAASNFYADMSTVDRLYAEAEGDVARFQDESVKSEKVSAWMLKFSDDKLIVLASSKHPQTVGGALPRQRHADQFFDWPRWQDCRRQGRAAGARGVAALVFRAVSAGLVSAAGKGWGGCERCYL